MRSTAIMSLVVGGAILASCGSETSGALKDGNGGEGEYTIDRETGETSATIETEEGTTTLRTGENVPVELPDGFSLYPDAKVVQNTRIEQAEGLVVGITMQIEDKAAKVAEHYKQQAQAAGYAIEMEMTADQTVMIGGTKDGGAQFTLNATEAGGATTAMLSLADGVAE